jgi:hypothetical protein
MSKQVWIGLVNLVPNEGNNDLKGAKGAYVNILAFAKSDANYRTLVKFASHEHNYSVKKIQDVELFDMRTKNYEVDEYLISLSKKVAKTGRTHFGEFYVYKEDD